MQTLNVREFRNAIPHLRETLEREHELILTSNGEPVARILPVTSAPRFQSMKWLREQMGPVQPDSTDTIRAERNRR